MDTYSKPKWHRSSKGKVISWEWYSRKCFFVTISPGSLEIQINKWKSRDHSKAD